MHIKKQASLVFLLMAFTLPINGRAQTKDSLLNQLATKWMNAKTYTLKVAALMAEEHFNFKPVTDEMTFGEQLLHIAQNMNWLLPLTCWGVSRIVKVMRSF